MNAFDATPAGGRRSAELLWAAVRRHPWVLTACVAALVAEAAVGLLVPIGIGMVVDVIAGDPSASGLVAALLVLGAGALGAGFSAAASGSLTARVTEPAVAALRESALETVLASDAATVEHAGTGDVVTRLTADVERLSEAASGALGAFVSAGLAILATLAGLAALDWRFAIAGLLAVPIQAGTLRWYLRRSGPVYRRARVAESERTQLTLDAVRDAAPIRALRLEARTSDAVSAASEHAVGLEVMAVRLSTRFFGRLNVAEFVGLAAISIVGFVLVGQDAVTLGAATTAALFFVRLFDPINTMLGLFDTVQQAGASLTRLTGLVGAGSAAPLSDHAREPGAPTEAIRSPSQRGAVASNRATVASGGATVVSGGGAVSSNRGAVSSPMGVVLRGVAVSFPGRGEALGGIHLRIAPGERLAVVGATGAGKTTLARAVAGLVQPTRGSIEYTDAAGRPVRDSGDRVPGIVLLEQRTHVFAGTLADDLRLVAPTATDAELLRAAEDAGIRLGSGPFADGLASPVGSGTALTPADAQHIALARLALARPSLAILDEASADAGSAAARRLEQAIDRVLAGSTAVIVAHRLSQAATADRVVLMARGRIIACGPHEQLLADESSYARLWDAWSTTRAGHP